MNFSQYLEAVIPGLPAKAEPGIQGYSTVRSGFALPLVGFRRTPE